MLREDEIENLMESSLDRKILKFLLEQPEDEEPEEPEPIGDEPGGDPEGEGEPEGGGGGAGGAGGRRRLGEAAPGRAGGADQLGAGRADTRPG